MRESWRAIALLAGAAWRTDRRRTLGLLLEPVSYLRIPLFAWFLGVLAEGALRRDARLLALGVGGLAVTRVLWFVGLWIGSRVRRELTEKVGLALDREIATLAAELPGLEHHERPDVQDRLELLRQAQGVLGTSLNVLVVAAYSVVAGVATLAALAVVSPWLL